MTSTFTVGLVQMRSGLQPAANLETATRLIGEAKAAGADYVQTPEMTNIVANQARRDAGRGRAGGKRREPRRFPRRWRGSSASTCISARSPSGYRPTARPTARS